MASDLKTTRLKDMKSLRLRMDGDDPFITSHQIKKIRTRERAIPLWTRNDKEVQKVLLRAFPNLKTSKASARRAGRWARVIYLYYRVQMSKSLVAKEMGETMPAVNSILRNIRRVKNNQRSDTSGQRGIRPLGRPPKH